MKPKTYLLPIIIVSQFACTSLWFAGNIALQNLPLTTTANTSLLGYVLSAVQLGFITGTLIFAMLNIADRFSPSLVFLCSAVMACLCNLTLLLPESTIIMIITARFGTGFFLAGIYPVGMKIASDYYQNGLEKALGYLVGALVLGTAFPHILDSMGAQSSPRFVLQITTGLALLGGLLVGLCIPNGPYRKAAPKLQFHAIPNLFKVVPFRKAAFGYFGHMWELYAFWGFIPLFLKHYSIQNSIPFHHSFWAFMIIAIGALSCIIGGYIALKQGSKKVATTSLIASCFLCLVSPMLLELPLPIFLAILLIWGMVVISDSPQFSTMVARAAPAQLRGTGLTVVNSIGFAISIMSIQGVAFLMDTNASNFNFMLLGIGPIFGIFMMRR